MELFGLADCNNFYCFCERVFLPDLIGKPIVVLSNNDGCVIVRSEESKALGVKMGDCLIDVDEKREKVLKLFPVEDILGIGYCHSKKLGYYGIP